MTKRAQWLMVAVLGVGAAVLFRPAGGTAQPPAGAGTGPTGGAKYTIVQTEGTNLLVVDNSANTLYYYTVDPGKEVGDDLKLRGSVDLTEVGRPVVKPRVAR
jgi:hypothetical protein